MMSSVDWPTIDPNSVHGDADTSDLFGGDLFGDELLDMYNSAEEISNMLPNNDGDNRGATASATDYDGLGALRPSNSLNDFTSILENKNTILPSPKQVAPVKSEMHVHHHTHALPAITANSTAAVSDNPTVVSLNKEPVSVTTSKKRPVSTIGTAVGTPSGASSEPPKKKSSPVTIVKPTDAQSVHRRGIISSVSTSSEKDTIAKASNTHTAITATTVKNTTSSIAVTPNTSLSTMNISQHPTAAVIDKAAISTVTTAAVAASLVPTIVKSSPSVVANATTAASVTTTSHSHPSTATISQVHNGNQIVATANSAKTIPLIQQKDASVTSPASLKLVTSESTLDSNGNITSPKTEESFKGVAQAAVTNLIMSAGSSRKEDVEKCGHPKPVDTSTAHVAALTSNNWVAACAASISGAPAGTPQAAQAAALAAASDPAAAKAARARRATLTADERARQNRDRNREHARNTRLRKKAYVEELKRTLTELVTQRDATDLERRHEKQRDLEVREVRYRVMEEFLKLRARGSEQNLLARWIAILEDGFTLTLPKTNYRIMVPNQEQLPPMTRRVSTEDATLNATTTVAGSLESSAQVLHGASQCFDDASKVSAFMSSVLQGSAVQMSYQCERTKFMMDGVKAVLDWTLKVTPQTQVTDFTAQSIILKGCMRATFSPASNKLAFAELLFDTGDAITQVKSIKMQQSMCPIAETDALLDSVLPQVSTMSSCNNQSDNNGASLPSSVSVVSTDKDSSDEEGVAIKHEPQTA